MEQRVQQYARSLGIQDPASSSKVNIAQERVDEVSTLMKTNISLMAKNLEEVEAKLLPTTLEIKA